MADEFGSALRLLRNPNGHELGIDNPETDSAYIKILSIGTLDKEMFIDLYGEFKKVTGDFKKYKEKYSKKIDLLLGGFFGTWLLSNEPESFHQSRPYREFLVK